VDACAAKTFLPSVLDCSSVVCEMHAFTTTWSHAQTPSLDPGKTEPMTMYVVVLNVLDGVGRFWQEIRLKIIFKFFSDYLLYERENFQIFFRKSEITVIF